MLFGNGIYTQLNIFFVIYEIPSCKGAGEKFYSCEFVTGFSNCVVFYAVMVRF